MVEWDTTAKGSNSKTIILTYGSKDICVKLVNTKFSEQQIDPNVLFNKVI